MKSSSEERHSPETTKSRADVVEALNKRTKQIHGTVHRLVGVMDTGRGTIEKDIQPFLPSFDYEKTALAIGLAKTNQKLYELLGKSEVLVEAAKPDGENGSAVDRLKKAFKEVEIKSEMMYRAVEQNQPVDHDALGKALENYQRSLIAVRDSVATKLEAITVALPGVAVDEKDRKTIQDAKSAIDQLVEDSRTMEKKGIDDALADLKKTVENQYISKKSEIYARQLGLSEARLLWKQDHLNTQEELKKQADDVEAALGAATDDEENKQEQKNYQKALAEMQRVTGKIRKFTREGSEHAVLEMPRERGSREMVVKPTLKDRYGEERFLLSPKRDDKKFEAAYHECANFLRVQKGITKFDLVYESKHAIKMKDLRLILKVMEEQAKEYGVMINPDLDNHLMEFLEGKKTESKEIFGKIKEINETALKTRAVLEKDASSPPRQEVNTIEQRVKVAAIDRQITAVENGLASLPPKKKIGTGDAVDAEPSINQVLGVDGEIPENKKEEKIAEEVKALEGRVQTLAHASDEMNFHVYEKAQTEKEKHDKLKADNKLERDNEIPAGEHVVDKLDKLAEVVKVEAGDVRVRLDVLARASSGREVKDKIDKLQSEVKAVGEKADELSAKKPARPEGESILQLNTPSAPPSASESSSPEGSPLSSPRSLG